MHYDIIVIGAGPAGLSFACALADAGMRILLVEKQPLESLRDPAVDGRDIALTHLSRKILQDLGVWQRFPPGAISPILQARVLDGDSDYALRFEKPASIDALGYLVPNHEIRKALYATFIDRCAGELVTETGVTAVETGTQHASATLSDGRTLQAALVVAADSRFSESRRAQGIAASMRDFGRVAIVCRMQHALPNDGTAFECFHYERTLAVLPLQAHLSSIVITVHADAAPGILAMNEAEFNADIQRRFHSRLGAMQLVGERYPYPLVAVHADRFAGNRYALLGDAAVGMHPVTAHGFNLGLRGADTLAREIRSALAVGRDIGGREVLQRYQSIHMRHTRPLYHGTNGIVGLFTNDTPPARLLRKLTLRLGNHIPPLKHMITRQLTEENSAAGTHLPFIG